MVESQWGQCWSLRESLWPCLGLSEPRPEMYEQREGSASTWLATQWELGQRLGGLPGGLSGAVLCCASCSHHLPAPAAGPGERAAVVG